jgi:Holliday junction resolvase RusA-like endonuclease
VIFLQWDESMITCHFRSARTAAISREIYAVPEQRQDRVTLLQWHNRNKITRRFRTAYTAAISRAISAVPQQERDHVPFTQHLNIKIARHSPMAQKRGHVTFPQCVPNVRPGHRQHTLTLHNVAPDIRNIHKACKT